MEEVINKDLYEEVALKTKVTPRQVEEIFKVVCGFTAAKIKEGSFETIMIPYFGKFKASPKKVQGRFNKKNPIDEIIRSNSGRGSYSKQTLDLNDTRVPKPVQGLSE